MLRTIAVIGAKGFVGSAICEEIEKRKEFKLIRICRGDDIALLVREAEVVIHAANSSKRFFAEKNPEIDFFESVEKTFKIKQLARGKKLILVSSISARVQLNAAYGRHRRACELIVDEGQSLIIRLGPMFGESKEVGALNDILNNRPCYVTEKTRYAYVNVAYTAKKIIDLVDHIGVIELGAKNAIELGELKKILGSGSTFSGSDDTQIPLQPQSDAPDAREILNFALNLRKVVR